MKTKQRHYSDVTILEVSGKITIGRGDVELRNAIAAVTEVGHRKILVNMEKVKRIDSSGIGELVAAQKRVANLGGELKLLSLSPKVSDVLQMTQILSVLEVFDDEASALASFDVKLAAVG